MGKKVPNNNNGTWNGYHPINVAMYGCPIPQDDTHVPYTITTTPVQEDVPSEKEDVRSYNVGNSDYPKHKIQPWDIWLEYHLDPWEADIVKRILRRKEEPGMTPVEARIMDYEKIIHISKEKIRQLKEGEDDGLR